MTTPRTIGRVGTLKECQRYEAQHTGKNWPKARYDDLGKGRFQVTIDLPHPPVIGANRRGASHDET